jgi:hypothetical protein
MRTRSLIVAAICGVSILGWAIGRGSGPAIAAHPCPDDVGLADRGVGIAAVQQGRLVGATSAATTRAVAEPSTLRHVAVGGAGTAYVHDLPGEDDLVLSTASGVRVLPQQGEAYHPTWSPNGAVAWGVEDRLAVRTPAGTSRVIPGPRAGGIVFAPVFAAGGSLVAAVSRAPSAAVPEDGWSDDLWRYQSGHWHRLTSFPAGRDRWSAIRTPTAAPDGSIAFVLVQGRGSQNGLPWFSLWRASGDTVQRIGPLDGERYLAGFGPEGDRLWNVPDRTNETWLIQRETPGGLETVGCGAVAVEPMDAADPDRVGHAAAAPAPCHHQERSVDPGDPMEAALLIGDFPSEVAADVVAQQVTAAYDGSRPVDVVTGGNGSTIVEPDMWAVLVRLPATTDGTAELEAMRALLPDYAGHMWVVVP